VSCNCIVSCESCVQPSEHWLKNDKKLPEQYVLRERRRERQPRTDHPSRPRERRLHRGPPPAIVLATGGRRGEGEGRGRGRGEKRKESHHKEDGHSQRVSAARGRTCGGSATYEHGALQLAAATRQGARSTSARVGHHAIARFEGLVPSWMHHSARYCSRDATDARGGCEAGRGVRSTCGLFRIPRFGCSIYGEI
jgi:hypothetical protein